MPYSAKAVANAFVEQAEEHLEELTPMKLLKLVYFAHGWHLALADEPLIDESVEAWKFGPVVPSVYHAFKHFGMNPITELAKDLDLSRLYKSGQPPVFVPRIPSDSRALPLLKKVWDVYGKLSAGQLSNLTHQPDSPWSIVWEREGKEIKGTDIPNNRIKEYFKQKLHQADARKTEVGQA